MTLKSSIGCPVAWLTCDREDTETFTVFFQKVKEKCPTSVHLTDVLMTDDGKG